MSMETVWMAPSGQLFVLDTRTYPPFLHGKFLLPTPKYSRTKNIADTNFGESYQVIRYQHEMILDGFEKLGDL